MLSLHDARLVPFCTTMLWLPIVLRLYTQMLLVPLPSMLKISLWQFSVPPDDGALLHVVS